jgi:hypothetical protein
VREQRIIVIYTQIPGVQGTNHGAAFARAGTENATLVTDVTDLFPAAGQRKCMAGRGLFTRDEARHLASNVAKLPELLREG